MAAQAQWPDGPGVHAEMTGKRPRSTLAISCGEASSEFVRLHRVEPFVSVIPRVGDVAVSVQH